MRIIWLLLVLAATPLCAQAQTSPVADNARVRLFAPALPATLYGRTVARKQDPGGLTLATPDDRALVTLSLDAVTRMDASRGRSRGRWALAGAGVGLLAGSIVGARAVGEDPEGLATFMGFIAGGGAGVITGAVVGFAYAPEGWRTVYSGTAASNDVHVLLAPSRDIKRFADGTIGVKGERNRRAGMLRGALALGGIALVFGGIDVSHDRLSSGEYVTTIAGNALFGAAAGYLISPRGWQRLPHEQ